MNSLRTLLLFFLVLSLSGCTGSSLLAKHSLNDPVLKNDRGTKFALMKEGVRYLKDDKLKAASEKFNAALALSPQNAQLHFLNALTYHMRVSREGDGLYTVAEQGYALAMRLAPSEWVYHLFYGLCKLDQNQYLEAKLSLADGLFLHAGNADLVYAFLYASYYDMDIENAVAALTRLQELEPDSMRTKVASVILAAASGNMVLARSQLRQLQPVFPNQNLAKHLEIRIEEWESAIAYYNERSESDVAGRTDEEQITDISQPEPVAPEMVVLDATIIRNEIENYSSTGINLLQGLQLQYGIEASRGRNISKDYSGGSSSEDWIFSSSDKSLTSAITESISIPTLTYNLNIFNSGSGHSEILARPTLVAALNQQSNFFAGTEINASVHSVSTTGYVSSTPVNFEIGVRLSVVPEEITADQVKMRVKIERSFLLVPDTEMVMYDSMIMKTKTEVDADVVIRFGETLMLSGLLEKQATSQKSGTVLLQNIPVVKYLFSNKLDDSINRSVLVMLTPYRHGASGKVERAVLTGLITDTDPKLLRLKQKYPDLYSGLDCNYAKIIRNVRQERRYIEARKSDLPDLSKNTVTIVENYLNSVLSNLR